MKIEFTCSPQMQSEIAPLLQAPWTLRAWLSELGPALTFEREVTLPGGLRGEHAVTATEDPAHPWRWAYYAARGSQEGKARTIAEALAALDNATPKE